MRALFFAPLISLALVTDVCHAQMQLPGAMGAPTPRGQSIAPPSAAQGFRDEEYAGHFTASKPPGIESVVGRPLSLLGARGALEIERSGEALVVTRFVAEGSKISHPNQLCEVSMGADGPINLKFLGSPAGVTRLELNSSACPLQFDILTGALRARSPTGACAFAQADCRIDAAGLWGPSGGSFSEREIKSIEKERGAMEKSMRAHFRALLIKFKKDMAAAKAVVEAQAAFPGARAQACRDYDREEAVGFCALRLTEAQDFLLQSQLAAEDGARKTEKRREMLKRGPETHALSPNRAPQ
jgi:hypothetical protein